MNESFDVTDIAGRRVLWVESARLQECLQEYFANDYTALGINPARGYHARDIEFLRECAGTVTGVQIAVGLEPFSLLPLKQLTNLRSLIVSAESKDISLESFERLEEFRGYWHPALVRTHSCLRVFDVSKYNVPSKDLTRFPSLPHLRVLSLVEADLVSVDGIEAMPELKQLELAYMRKLQNLDAVRNLRELDRLECLNCPRLQNVEEAVSALENIRVLRLNRCPPLSSLQFLNRLPRLEEFRFVDTRVLDGDLRPLLRLKRVGFLRTRGYSHSPEEIDRLIAPNASVL